MSPRYYQKNKKRLQKKGLVKSIKIFLKKRKTKSISVVVNDIKLFLKKKQQRLIKYRKKLF